MQVTLTEASAPFVSVLALGQAKIVPRDVAEQKGERLRRGPVGTGPFRFVAAGSAGRAIVLGREPRRVSRARPASARARVPDLPRRALGRHVPRSSSRAASRTARCRRSAGASRTDAAAGDHVYVRRPTFSLRSLRAQHAGARAARTIARVRQAIAHALDRSRRSSAQIFAGRFIPARGILPPGMLGFNPGCSAPSCDPARARDLLASRQGIPAAAASPPIDALVERAGRADRCSERGQIGRDLTAVGISAEIQLPDRLADVLPACSARAGTRCSCYAWYADVPDPDNFLHLLFYSQSPRNCDRLRQPRRRPAPAPGAASRAISRGAPSSTGGPSRSLVDEVPVLPVWHYTLRAPVPGLRPKNVEVNGLGDAYMPLRTHLAGRGPGERMSPMLRCRAPLAPHAPALVGHAADHRCRR